MKSLKSIVYICAVIVNIAPVFIYRLFVGKLHGDENLIYVMFFIAIILSLLFYLPVLIMKKIRALKICLFMPTILYFIFGTLGIITQIIEDGEFYISKMLYAYTYFIINIVYAYVVYKYYIVSRYSD